jgi:hypothetical protein
MEKIKKGLAEMTNEEFQKSVRPIEEQQNSGTLFFDIVHPVTKERTDVCMSFYHNIYRDWFKTEFTYQVIIHLGDENGPLFPVDQINMEISREIDHSNYVISSYNNAQAYHRRTFNPGPSGTSCLTPVIIYQGYEYRFVQMCQSANRDKVFELKEIKVENKIATN